MSKFKNIMTGNTAFDRKTRKFFFGVDTFQKLPLRGRIVKGFIFGVYNISLIIIIWFLATGALPFGPTVEGILPPEMQLAVTAEQAEEVIGNSALDLDPYGEGNNCLDLAQDVKRQLEWEGYLSFIVKLDFGTEVGHAIIGIPTVDEGWKFWAPQLGIWVYPRAGGFWEGNLIVGMYYAKGYDWELIEVMVK